MELLKSKREVVCKIFVDQIVFTKETKAGSTLISIVVVIDKGVDKWSASTETEIINKKTCKDTSHSSIVEIDYEELVFFVDELDRKGFTRII